MPVFIAPVAGAEKLRVMPGTSVDCLFTVTNSSSEAVDLGLRARAESPAHQAWFSVKGDLERKFPAGRAEQVTVAVSVPEGTAAGTYPFRLQSYATDNPELTANSPTVAVEVPAARQEEPRSEVQARPRRWRLMAVAAVVVVAGVLAYVFWPSPDLPALTWGQGIWDQSAWQ